MPSSAAPQIYSPTPPPPTGAGDFHDGEPRQEGSGFMAPQGFGSDGEW